MEDTTSLAGTILGVNSRHYPTEGPGGVHNMDPPATRAVLVAGAIGDYACYVGNGSPEWVARFGDKISFEEACCHFPGGQIKRECYRD